MVHSIITHSGKSETFMRILCTNFCSYTSRKNQFSLDSSFNAALPLKTFKTTKHAWRSNLERSTESAAELWGWTVNIGLPWKLIEIPLTLVLFPHPKHAMSVLFLLWIGNLTVKCLDPRSNRKYIAASWRKEEENPSTSQIALWWKAMPLSWPKFMRKRHVKCAYVIKRWTLKH